MADAGRSLHRGRIAALMLALSANANAAEPAQPALIPFELEGANIVVEVEIQPGHRLPFVFDSGLSNGNLLDVDAARALGIRGDQSLSIGGASGEQHAAALTHLSRVGVGAATLRDSPFAIVQMPDEVTRRQGKRSIGGFLGAPLLEGAVLCVDYAHMQMQRWATADFDAAKRVSLPMRQRHELPTIAVSIEGEPATMIVDSGNNGAVVVYPSFVARSHLRQRHPELLRKAGKAGNDGGGRDFQALGTEVDSVEIAPGIGFRHVPLAIIPQGMDPAWGIDGMVGFEVLSRLNPCLDRDGERFMFDDP